MIGPYHHIKTDAFRQQGEDGRPDQERSGMAFARWLASEFHERGETRATVRSENFGWSVTLRREHREYDTAIQGIPPKAYLRQVVDTELKPIAIPAHGIVLTERLAEILGAAIRRCPEEWSVFEPIWGDRAA